MLASMDKCKLMDVLFLARKHRNGFIEHTEYTKRFNNVLKKVSYLNSPGSRTSLIDVDSRNLFHFLEVTLLALQTRHTEGCFIVSTSHLALISSDSSSEHPQSLTGFRGKIAHITGGI
jgi:hypothetical protein